MSKREEEDPTKTFLVGPPQSYPEFDGWDERQHKEAESTIKLLDGIKNYKNGGTNFAQYKPAYVQLHRRGGLTPDEASQIARYKMWRQGKNTPAARVPEETDEQIDARAAARVAATPERRAEMFREMDAHKDDSYTRFYDDLIGQPKKPKTQQPATPPQAQTETTKKTGGA